MDFVITPTIYMIVMALTIAASFPSSVILRRLGYSPWLSLVCFVPLLAILLLWYLAYSNWPKVATANDPAV